MSLTKATFFMTEAAPVNLADYGVVGDGIANDTAAIQSAIAALAARGTGNLTGPAGATYKITSQIDFSVLGNTHKYYTLDFAGATFIWHGSPSGSAAMFYFFNNKALTVKNFTLYATNDATISPTVRGIYINSLQPDGSDLLVFSDFRVRYAAICVNIGSVGVDQNRVSDSRFEHFLLEGSSVGVQTNSTNCDSLIFTNGQLSGCAYGFNFVRAGFNKIDTCIGYACDPFIRVAGPIGPLTVINTQSEAGGLVDPSFFYRQIYTNAKEGTVSFVSCNMDNKIWLDYDAGIGSAAQTVNIYGGYFRTLTVDVPDATVNLFGTHQVTGYDLTVAGLNAKVFNYGSRLDGTLIDTANGFDPVSPSTGSFTPTIVGTSTAGTATYADQVGVYTRMGDLCYFQIRLIWSAGTGTGNLRVAGLPFTSANNTTNAFGTVGVGYSANVALSAGDYMTAYVPSSSSQIAIMQNPTGGGAASAVSYDAAGEILLSGWYKVA